MSVAVYQMNAADGRVLYVGQTINLGSRLGTHAAGQPWWEQVATIVVEHCPDREAATALEASRIAELTPEFNRHNVERGPRGDALAESDRRILGARIRHLRMAKCLTQQDLAEAITSAGGGEINRSAVAHWERGMNSPGLRHREALAVSLGTTVPELFERVA